MHINQPNYNNICNLLQNKNATLVAVSKIKPPEAIRELYDMGHRDFGENYVQELVDKQTKLPSDIRWHFIGHLQTNKVKYLAPFVHLIHGIDSLKLLQEVSKQAKKAGRTIDVLLQVHIAKEETKFGLDDQELVALLASDVFKELTNVRVAGLMGMASFSDDEQQVRSELRHLKLLYEKYAPIETENCRFRILSMGMSGDYKLALEEGSNMVRIGSLLFGSRS